MTTPNLDKVRALDFNRLADLVSERIEILQLYAQNIDKTSANDMICRDLILPCVHLLVDFIESVKINGETK